MNDNLPVLYKISRVLNHAGIIWGLGGSQALIFYGLLDTARDLDIFIAEKDVQRALAALKPICQQAQRKVPGSNFFSEYCFELTIESVNVDLMAVFHAYEDENDFLISFDSQRIGQIVALRNESIPLMALEDWWALYWMIKRDEKALLIEEYLILNPEIIHINLLADILKQNIPEWLNIRGLKLLTLAKGLG